MTAQGMARDSAETEGTEWRRVPISPYRAYEVSDDGRVRRGGQELVGYTDRYGYRRVLLSYAGLAKHHKVHRLVCEAFHGPPNVLRNECAHLDGNKRNNNAANLRWVSRSENQQHNVLHGIHGGGVSGERHHAAKVSDAQVAEIRMKAAAGRSGRSLAKEYGLLSAQTSKIIRGDARKTAGSETPND
jgi:hypothetical protein